MAILWTLEIAIGLKMSAFYTTVARYYDAETGDKTDDLVMYSRLAAECSGDILDVGCGTGRVLLHLGQEGYRVHGIENDRAMLDRFERKLAAMPNLCENVSCTFADATAHEFDRDFGLILLTYNALMHFREQDEQIKLLRQLRFCLADGGILVIDLPNAGPVFGSDDTDALTLERKFLDTETGNLIMLQSVSYLDRAAQILQVDWIYDDIDGDGVVKRLIAPHQLRYYFLPELRLLLEHCGFSIADVYGDTENSPFKSESDRMIVYARGK